MKSTERLCHLWHVLGPLMHPVRLSGADGSPRHTNEGGASQAVACHLMGNQSRLRAEGAPQTCNEEGAASASVTRVPCETDRPGRYASGGGSDPSGGLSVGAGVPEVGVTSTRDPPVVLRCASTLRRLVSGGARPTDPSTRLTLQTVSWSSSSAALPALCSGCLCLFPCLGHPF